MCARKFVAESWRIIIIIYCILYESRGGRRGEEEVYAAAAERWIAERELVNIPIRSRARARAYTRVTWAADVVARTPGPRGSRRTADRPARNPLPSSSSSSSSCKQMRISSGLRIGFMFVKFRSNRIIRHTIRICYIILLLSRASMETKKLNRRW